MNERFSFDVFLSYSSKDKEVVRPLASRLQENGVRVWFNEWELEPGDDVSARIQAGLENSRVLVLCLSENALGSDWHALERQTFRFRDPRNKDRRFVPLRLDNAPLHGALAQFACIDWRPEARDSQFAQLLAACRPTEQESAEEREGAGRLAEEVEEKILSLGHDDGVASIAFSPDGKLVLLGSDDATVRLWEVGSGRELRELKGHTGAVMSGAFSLNGGLVLSGSDDATVRLWELGSGRELHVLKGHTQAVYSVAFSPDGKLALSSSDDATVRLWEVGSGRELRELKGHTGAVMNVAFSPDGELALSGSDDETVRLWEVASGRLLRVLEGQTDFINSVIFSPNGKLALAGGDQVLRLWDVDSGRALRVLEGHTDWVNSVAFSPDGSLALSGSDDKTVRLWDLGSGRALRVMKGHSSSVLSVIFSQDGKQVLSATVDGVLHVWNVERAEATALAAEAPKISGDQIQYTNAKVLLVGDSGVGKTGLARYLALNIKDEECNLSTDGAWATQWTLPNAHAEDQIDREIWLWDFAGQVDYRLVHQLFMDDTAAAVMVFNPQDQNPFECLGQWDRDLHKAARKPFAKLLAAGRIDRGGLVVSRKSVESFMRERGFVPSLHETSARTGEGCGALRDSIVAAIEWENIPITTSRTLYHQMKEEVLKLRDNPDDGPAIIRLAELKQRMEFALPGVSFTPAELQTVVGLLAGPGMVQNAGFGDVILLRPELLSRYAAALVRKVRKHPKELGCISERDLLAGNLDYQDFVRLPQEQETIVLKALNETLVSRAWCLKQLLDGEVVLTFPSYFRRERPQRPGQPSVLVTYRFAGPADDIYATLVVRLHYTPAFESADLWRFAADFKTQTGKGLGLMLARESEGNARLDLYFDSDVDQDSQVLFARYVHNHLKEYAQNVVRLRHYACANTKCKAYSVPLVDRTAIDEALASGEDTVFCSRCGKPILLHDLMEKKFASSKTEAAVRELQAEVQQVLDNESRELLLVGHAFTIAAEAGQIYRGYTNSDHGIDGEIEFKGNDGRATGKRLYLQLKSGDSYLTKRRRDGAEVFHVKKARWASYWQSQAYPVMLVIRNSKGETRWMDVTEYLKRAGKQIKQIVFEGERFDALSVIRWRDRVLARPS